MKLLIVIIIFLKLISYLVIFDVILSWLVMFWLKIRPKFVSDILDPIYLYIKKIIPTNIWPFELTPIIIIFIIYFIEWTIYILFPEIIPEINNLLN